MALCGALAVRASMGGWGLSVGVENHVVSCYAARIAAIVHQFWRLYPNCRRCVLHGLSERFWGSLTWLMSRPYCWSS